jgi:3-hydroxyisobutyrate dehydrogenase-like beta-hydroxyacid dehydrogenase
VVNDLLGIQVAALAETLALLQREGMDTPLALATLDKTPVLSAAARGAAQLITTANTEPLYPIDLVVKDFGYIEGLLRAAAVHAPVSAAARQLYLQAQRAALGGRNITAVAGVVEPAFSA